jgi:wobble nucleotide-excising tRNase
LHVCEEVLASSVAGISKKAAERVAAHIERHRMEVHGERWIKYGLDHMIEGTCPFCTQSVEHVDLVNVFRDFFSESYSEHARQVEAEAERVKAFQGGPMDMKTVLAQNAEDLSFWNDVTDLPCLPEIAPDQASTIQDGIASLCACFDRKRASPFAQFQLASDRSKVARALELLAAYNEQMTQCITAIENTRQSVRQADPTRAEAVLNGKKALRAKATTSLSEHTAKVL